MKTVTLVDNKAYAIYNDAGVLNIEDVSVLTGSDNNAIMNKASIVTSGNNVFETLIENGTSGGAETPTFETTGSNTFKSTFTNYGTLTLGGTNDNFVNIAGVGEVTFAGTATITGTYAKSLVTTIAQTL